MGGYVSSLLLGDPVPRNEPDEHLEKCYQHLLNGDTSSALTLVPQIVDVDCPCEKANLSLLHVAAKEGNLPCLKALIDRTATINVIDNRQFTPLHLAVETSQQHDDGLACIHHLIAAGTYLNAQDIWGKTPLQRAALFQNFPAMEALLMAGCDVNCKDDQGRNVLHYIANAFRNTEKHRLEIFFKYGIDYCVKDVGNRTALHHAILSSNTNLICLLAEYGCNLSQERYFQLAMAKKNENCLNVLLELGAAVCLNYLQIVRYETFSPYSVSEDIYSNSVTIGIIRQLLRAKGHAASSDVIRTALLHMTFELHGRTDKHQIVSLISMIVAATGISLFCVSTILAGQDKTLETISNQIGYDSVATLQSLCRVNLRQHLVRYHSNMVVAANKLTMIPPVMRDFLLIKDF